MRAIGIALDAEAGRNVAGSNKYIVLFMQYSCNLYNYSAILCIMKPQTELVLDTSYVKDNLRDLSDKRGKIARMIHAGQLIQLRRGLYATKRDIHPFCLADAIYGPCYISYEAALSFHGLIPEAVYEITCASLKRPREFENLFGRFCYHAIPRAVYPIGLERVSDTDLPFMIASPTKALCDRIALEPGLRSLAGVRRWITLTRISESIEIDHEVLAACADQYHRPAVRLLHRLIAKHGRISP